MSESSDQVTGQRFCFHKWIFNIWFESEFCFCIIHTSYDFSTILNAWRRNPLVFEFSNEKQMLFWSKGDVARLNSNLA